jgi:hypothetical protein
MIHVSPAKFPRAKIKTQHIFQPSSRESSKHRSDDNFLILRTLRMVFKGVVGVKNVRTLKNVSKDYVHGGDVAHFPFVLRRFYLIYFELRVVGSKRKEME